MLQVVKDYVTWGEVEKDVVTRLLKQRGRLTGDKPLTDEHVQSATSFNTIDDLSGALIKETVKINEIPELKKVFRLHPPQKGFEGTKKSFVNKGALGYRGNQMKDLLEKMI